MNLLSTTVVLRNALLLSTLMLTACQPNSSKPQQQNIHSQDGAFTATISHSGKYATVSSLYHGVAAWDLTRNGIKYNWYQTPKEQSFALFNDDSNATADNNFVLATAISFDDSHALLADKHRFSLWHLASGENIGYWQLPQATVSYRTSSQENANNNQLYDVVTPHHCEPSSLQAGQGCEFTSDIRAIDVSNQGQQLLLGKSDGKVLHINLTTGRRLEFLGHQQTLFDDDSGETFHLNNAINSVALSPNGHFALSGSSDQSAYLWDTRTGQVVYKFQHQARVVMVALDPKGKFAFTADSKKGAKIWDLSNGQQISQLAITARQQIFTSARFNQAGTMLVTGSPNQKLTLWQTASGKKLQQWLVTPRKNSRPASAVVYSASFINNDSQIISESSAGLSEIWNISYEQ